MDIKKISGAMLFRGMSEEEVSLCLKDLKARERRYSKGDLILHAGDLTDRMGLVTSGGVTIETNDVWGNCTILSHIGEGQVFAETYAMLPREVLLVDVKASEDCTVLFLDIGGMLTQPAPLGLEDKSALKSRLIRNLLMITANKNLTLSGRSFHTSPKSARGRILSYLNSVSLRKHSDEFDIPFNRQQLADYLNLERTNMSKELSRMQREGIIKFRKNHFKLLEPEE